MTELKLYFVQHEATRLWILVDKSMVENLPDEYVNNLVEVTGYEKGALHYDVSFGHITGRDWREFNKIIAILEDSFYKISENLSEHLESFIKGLANQLNINALMCGIGIKYPHLSYQPVKLGA